MVCSRELSWVEEVSVREKCLKRFGKCSIVVLVFGICIIFSFVIFFY